jgi:hypothetical protein
VKPPFCSVAARTRYRIGKTLPRSEGPDEKKRQTTIAWFEAAMQQVEQEAGDWPAIQGAAADVLDQFHQSYLFAAGRGEALKRFWSRWRWPQSSLLAAGPSPLRPQFRANG